MMTADSLTDLQAFTTRRMYICTVIFGSEVNINNKKRLSKNEEKNIVWMITFVPNHMNVDKI